MDPNANLAEQRVLIARWQGVELDTFTAVNQFNADMWRLMELVKALDGWIMGGGIPPLAWRGRR